MENQKNRLWGSQIVVGVASKNEIRITVLKIRHNGYGFVKDVQKNTECIKNMTAKEFVDIIRPEHCRSSCSDDNLYNGFGIDEYEGTVENHRIRCKRCAYLHIISGEIELTSSNIKTIRKLLGTS